MLFLLYKKCHRKDAYVISCTDMYLYTYESKALHIPAPSLVYNKKAAIMCLKSREL